MQILTEAQARVTKVCHVCGQPKARAALVCSTCAKGSKRFTPLERWIGGFFADWQMHVKLILEFQPDKDAEGTGRTNEMRVTAAQMAMAKYTVARVNGPAHRAELLTDLLADLMHMAQAGGIRFDKSLASAIGHYEYEK